MGNSRNSRWMALFVAAGLAVIIIALLAWAVPHSNRVNENVQSLFSFFQEVTSRAYYLLALLLFASLQFFLFYAPQSESDFVTTPNPTEGKSEAKFWAATSLALTMLVVAINFYVNPHARFDQNHFNHYYVEQWQRRVKIDIYKEFEDVPEILVMGSSKAAAITTDHLQKMTGLTAFNIAVGGHRSSDGYSLLQLALAEKPQLAPELIIYEINVPSLLPNADQPTLEQAKYLDQDADFRSEVLNLIAQDTISSKALFDSFFILYQYFHYGDELEPTYLVFDQGTTFREPVTEDKYISNIENHILVPMRCNNLDKLGKTYINAIVDTANDLGSSILFYRSPFNVDDFNTNTFNRQAFKNCAEALDKFMQQLDKKNDNVIYINLFDDDTLSALRNEVYLDRVHLSNDGSDMLIDMLQPQINQLLQREP